MEQLTLITTTRRPGYRAYTLDTQPAAAEQAFVRRYGKPPAEIVVSRGLLLAGPIPEDAQ
jgi:hypothetical protein